MPRWLVHLVLVVGWLLTPVLAWGASYFGIWLGALVAVHFRSPAAMLGVALGFAFTAGFVVLAFWVRFMRRAPSRLMHLVAAHGGGHGP